MRNLKKSAVAISAGLFVAGFAACDVDQTEEGDLPNVDVQVEEGRLPEYDVEGPRVEVGRDTVTVPRVEVEPPRDAEPPR